MSAKTKPATERKAARSAHTMTFRQQAEEAGRESKVPDWALDLNHREFRFLMEYTVDMDGRKAAVRAGLCETEKEGHSVSVTLLRHDEVKAALEMYLAQGNEARQALRNRMIEELSALAFYETGDFLAIRKNTLYITDTDELTVHQMKAFKRVKQTKGKSPAFEIEFHDKVKAMELLDRMTGGNYGGSNVNVNVNGNGSNKIGIALQITPLEAMASGLGAERIKNGQLIDENGNPIPFDEVPL